MHWICPFKAVTEFEQVTSVESVAKAGIFLSLFGGLVVVLPIMTRKRTQCSFLCPLGAVNAVADKITPFKVKIDKSACTECFKCVEVCPLYALTREDIKAGKVSLFCSKCGKCVDACSKKAIHYGIKGVPAGTMKNFSRNLFLFVSFLFMAVFSSGSIISSLQNLLKLHLLISEKMKKVKIFAGIIWAFAGLIVIIVMFPGLNSLSGSVSRLPFMKIHPRYTGGEVAYQMVEQSCTLNIRKPVFNGFFSDRKSGFVQLDWRGTLPEVINDTIDYDKDGITDFSVSG